MSALTSGLPAQLFVIDPIARLRPTKDSSVALMQAAQRAGQQVWVCTPAQLSVQGQDALVQAQPIRLAEIRPTASGWDLPDQWFEADEPRWLPLSSFPLVWMRKDPPVDEAYLYATHLLELAERQGVRVLNRPASLRAWNEKLGALRWSHLMAQAWSALMWSNWRPLLRTTVMWCSNPSAAAPVKGSCAVMEQRRV